MADQGQGYDLIVRGDLVWPGVGSEPLARAGVGIRAGRIAHLGPWSDFEGLSGPSLGGPDRLVMPGLVNGHTHLPMVLFRGLADDLALMDWLRNHVWPAEAATVNEEMVYWTDLLALAEAIRSGTTTLADSYFCQKGALKAVHESGLRAVVAQGIIDLPAPGVPDPGENLAVAREFLEAGQGLSPLIKPALFCHAPYTCGPKTLAGAKALADEFGTLCFIHLAETEADTGLVMEARGQRPTAFLDGLGFFDRRTVAVHGVHLEPAELELLARRGVGLVTCPESNMKLASGRARVDRWLAAGLRIGLGTDGAASNNDLNLFGEMGTLARWHKGAEEDPTLLPAGTVLSLATTSGAGALGQERLGRLDPGREADLITLDLSQPHLLPLHNLQASLVYSAHGGEVADSVVGGRPVMVRGELRTIDLAGVSARVEELARRLR